MPTRNDTPLTAEQRSLAERHVHLVYYVTKRYSEMNDYEDLQGHCMNDLVLSARSYQGESEGPYLGYACMALRNSIATYFKVRNKKGFKYHDNKPVVDTAYVQSIEGFLPGTELPLEDVLADQASLAIDSLIAYEAKQDRSSRVRSLVARLPKKQREAVLAVLDSDEHMSLQELADKLGTTLDSANKRLIRGKHTLRKLCQR